DLDEKLNYSLAKQYGKNPDNPTEYEAWKHSHRPFHWFAEFYGIIHEHGGFDVMIGNPPYVEYSKVRKSYELLFYDTLACGNLYAFVLERVFDLIIQKGRSGLIMPLSLVCTDRMNFARTLLHSCISWISCFDIRPSSLFEGVAQRLCIALSTRDSSSEAIYSAGYKRWLAEERQDLISQLTYVLNSQNRAASAIAKIGYDIEQVVLVKIDGASLKMYAVKTSAPIYVHRIVRYFVKALDFIPLYIDSKGKRGKSDDYKPFRFVEPEQGSIVALLNSSLFYWFWRLYSDGFHCGYGDVYRMPYREIQSHVAKRFYILQEQLMNQLKDTSIEKTISTKTGNIRYQEFSIKSAKFIIDEIDRIFAQHYGFTDEELDFIINYDIKYRMGKKLKGN
ncbi:MAG: SAM-dependent methyltransferase, partial [Deltaproteobacteria bacterium]|nr:SAM-dependent methyltransferase [Deltaproteobacteria bacterium]